MARVQSTEHFSEYELKCKCGKCEFPGMDLEFMNLIETIRVDPDWQKPMRVSSAYRCPAYNTQVSSTGENGPHTTGQAMDFLVSGKDAHKLLGLAMDYGFTGIGISQKGPHSSRFIHLDNLTLNRPWIWSY